MRLPLLAKILLSTSVLITAVFGVTGEIVLHHIQRTVSDGLEDEVRNSFQAYTSLFQARAELLRSVSRMMASLPEVRLAFSTGDRATIRDTASELWAKISPSNAIFLVTDPKGRPIASLGGKTPLADVRELELVPEAAARFPEQSSGFFYRNSELYQVTVTPVYIDSTQGPALLDVLVAGYQVDAIVARELKERTNSEFVFVTQGRAVTSTLNPRAAQAVVAAGDQQRVSDGLVQYARFGETLLDIGGKPVGEISILRSFEGAEKRVSSLTSNIVLVWLAAILLGLGTTYAMARRIVEPVKQLDRAAAEVARQNYQIEVEARGDDELGRLAQTFNGMCASIRQAREDLIRQERIATIGRLSGSIVHDLRNPLAAIYGGAEMLVDADLPPGHVKRLARNIYRASQRIQELLQDLLNVSSGKRGVPEPCRLRELALAACDALAASAEGQGVTVTLDIAPEIEVPLERSRMERAFVNLIGNAIEAMPEGGAVNVAAAIREGSVLVEVRDTGPGIAPEIRAQLFQPFVTGKRNGLGLGLALSRQTVLEHGGEMWVESEPGKGARFRFRLPGARVVERVGA
jgi:signal transduction histidine kinase